jgi:hypothetical protein
MQRNRDDVEPWRNSYCIYKHCTIMVPKHHLLWSKVERNNCVIFIINIFVALARAQLNLNDTVMEFEKFKVR